MTPLLSFLYPIYNRAGLFATTLRSWLQQRDRDIIPFELLVIDDGSTEPVLPLAQDFAVAGLPIRYLRIDLTRYPTPIYRTPSGANNPAAVVNVGIREARGAWIVLTSPEIFHRSSRNLQHFATSARQAGTLDVLMADVWDESLHFFISGGPRARMYHFLAAFHAEFLRRIGGMDERFMEGYGHEDSEFTRRTWLHGARWVSCRQIQAEHLFHPREEMADRPDMVAAWERNLAHAREAEQHPRDIANLGQPWGDPALVMERWEP